MPEPLPQPEPAPAPAPKKKRVSGGAVLQKLKTKYRLDDRVRLDALAKDGTTPLGWGPLMSPEVFDKLASIDPSPKKVHLDWMLYQAGGGSTAFTHSLNMWGEGVKETSPADLLMRFNKEVPSRINEKVVPMVIKRLRDYAEIDVPNLAAVGAQIAEAGRAPTDQERYHAILKVLNTNKVGPPEKRERMSRELLSYILKQWIKDQYDIKVRDRVHAVFAFNRLAQGISLEVIEQEWKEKEPKTKREYVFGDQDNLKYQLFGFYRDWDYWNDKEHRYQRVYDVMREFLASKDRVERRNSQLEQYNAAIQAKNQTLPPDQQIPLREPINISLDIGRVILDRKNHLTYQGEYPTVDKLAKANELILDLPMRERVSGDIRYAGPKGKVGRGEKIYSDDNLTVTVPLTVAAAIKAGHASWPVADPEQLNVQAKGHHNLSTWSQWAAGHHNHPEWEGSQVIPIVFNFNAVLAGEDGQVPLKVLLMVFMDDLVQLQPPYIGTLWRVQEGDDEISFAKMVKYLKQALNPAFYSKAMRSLTAAIRAIRDWGQEFDPSFLVGDYVAYHREKLTGKRNRLESVSLRASQVLDLLLE